MVVAPATANTLSKMASGTCDNLLIATYLSAKCPVWFAPAMDLDMYKHPSTINNIKTLIGYGNICIEATEGELASGLNGAGRMAEPADILAYLNNFLNAEQDLIGKTVLITAGPTQEAFDPVRFIGNHSTGRMGIELAQECASRGAKVELIMGPTNLKIEHPSVDVTPVISAQDMYEATISKFEHSDISIFCAAVADYRPKTKSENKIKKSESTFSVELERTPDIAMECGERKTKNQTTSGFALETQKGPEAAKTKLKKKNLDIIVLNSLKDKGAGFKHNTNKISIVHRDGSINEYPLKTKKEVAKDVIDTLITLS